MGSTQDVPKDVQNKQANAGRAILDAHRSVWSRKPALRRIYESYFHAILDECTPHRPIVELGSGPGFLKDYCPEIISTDIAHTPWIDAVVDGRRLPFQNASVGNIVMMDVFHHIARPRELLEEASRVLKLGGRLIMLEPWTSPLGYLFYRYIHHEGADRHVDPLRPFENDKAAFDGNAALPRLYFDSPDNAAAHALKQIDLDHLTCRRLPAFSWLLTGGFRPYSLLPNVALPLARGLDALLTPLKRWCSLRTIIVLERATGDIKNRDRTDLSHFAHPGLRGSTHQRPPAAERNP